MISAEVGLFEVVYMQYQL